MLKFHLWKIALLVGIILSLVSFILGWIGFGVPDWHAFQRYDGSPIEYYGLWAYCQEQAPVFATVCRRWSTAEDQLFNGSRPNFIKTSEGLITTGMILLSIGLAIAIIAAVLPYLAYGAAFLAFLAFIFLVVGLPIFGRESNNLSVNQGNFQYNKRYGFWLFVPVIVLEFLSILCYLAAGILYHLFSFGNVTSGFRTKQNIYGGQRALGVPNMLNTYGMTRVPRPYGIEHLSLSSPQLSPMIPARTTPSLLSEYVTLRRPQHLNPIIPQSRSPGVLPQPTVVRALSYTCVPNVAPAYNRIEQPYRPSSGPVINLSNQTLTGPLRRIS